MSLAQFSRMKVIAQRDGLSALVTRIYTFGYNNIVRTRLPKQGSSVVEYNSVKIHDDEGKLLDGIVPKAGHIPLYEQPIIRGVANHVLDDDRVVVIGSGLGAVTTICAAQTSEPVVSYEGSSEMYERSLKTYEMNNISERVVPHHAVVAENIGVWGAEGDAAHVTVDELPRCDVMILDCEGAEFQIVENLEDKPRVIIVETHGEVPTMVEMLTEGGYEIDDVELYNPDQDLYVLTCVQSCKRDSNKNQNKEGSSHGS